MDKVQQIKNKKTSFKSIIRIDETTLGYNIMQERAEKVYRWMEANPDNDWVQITGRGYLRQLKWKLQ